MKASRGNKKNRTGKSFTTESGKNRKQILPALMAVGGACGIVAGPAAALELGELTVNSSLGQPLRASIAYALNPHEELYDFCVYLRPTLAPNGLPTVSKASISVADGLILLTGSRAIREPMLTMQVSIDCPYTAHLSREYTLLIDPPVPVVREGPMVVESAPGAAAPAVAPRATEASPAPQPRVRTRRDIDRSPIPQNGRYLVQRGDTVSEIAARIADRSMPLWPAVDRIFAANPSAFMDGDMNRLMAGTWLDIPDLSDAASVVDEVATAAVAEPEGGASDESVAYTGYDAPEMPMMEEPPVTAYETPVSDAQDVTETMPQDEPEAGASDFAELQPGDVVVMDDSLFVTPTGSDNAVTESIDIPDTEISLPSHRPAPVVETGGGNAGKTTGSWSWLFWLGGTGLALILGLLLFGQKLRQRFGSVAVGAASEPLPNRRRTDAASRATQAFRDVDFEVEDGLSHSASITLDADFDDGTGLQGAADMDVAQDFGFSASTTFEDELDMEFPDHVEYQDDSDPTDIMEPDECAEDPQVVDSETLQDEDDDGDYDLSMIVDVTKQDVVQPDATEKDLQAVQVETEAEVHSDDYTLSQETDYKILEQDYEDELTATQALNAEIEKAATELAERMDLDATGEMTAKLPENTEAVNDPVSDSGANAITAELPAAGDDQTGEMSANDDDITANMVVESGKLDTKKKKKAS